MPIQLSDPVRDVLTRSTITSTTVTLPPEQLERKRAILVEAGLRDPLAVKTVDGITPTENP